MRKQKKKSRHSKQTHNRQYKDRLWRMVFNNKEDLLQLYNAINHTDYQNPGGKYIGRCPLSVHEK